MALVPFETLFDTDAGQTLPMPPELAMLYGKLQFPLHPDRPYVISNFVETLDGITSLNLPEHSGGVDISGNNEQDRVLMGILRAAADAVIVGAGTLRAVPRHLWTAEHIFPALATAYGAFRSLLGKAGPPLTVIVSGSGIIDASLPVFNSGRTSALIVTNREGLEQTHKHPLPPAVHVEAVPHDGKIRAREVIDAVNRVGRADTVLVEGGSHLLGDFVAEDLLDELFLTLAPQIAGQPEGKPRLGLIEGKEFAPGHPLWTRLVSVKRGESHLFLRYAF